MIIVKAKYLITNPENCTENGAIAVKGTKIYRVGTFNRVLALSNKKGIDMRTAALMLGIGRVAEAKKLRGLYP